MNSKLLYFLATALIIISCGTTEVMETMPPSPEEGPPAFPYVFMGDASVDDKPIREGTIILAKFGKSKSKAVATLSGRYMNVLVAPYSLKEAELLAKEKAVITFHLQSSSGNTVESKETFIMKKLDSPEIVTMDLHFNSYPQ
tara:strand:+ start:1541 stop:1966 length:426 start_codon:yes stop_codon:yes gene_type:complete